MNRLLLFLSLACSTLFSYGQSLSKSRQSSYHTFIYKLTDEEAYMATNESVNDGFMHHLVDSFYTDKGYKNNLPYGNYLFVNAANGELVYDFKPVYNVLMSSLNRGVLFSD